MNTSGRKKERRKKEQREKDTKSIFTLFKDGPLQSQYKAYRDPKSRDIAQATLRRDLSALKDLGYLRLKRGSRGAKKYSLTFKGLVTGLKIDAFDLKDMHKIRLKNKIVLPVAKLSMPMGKKLLPNMKDIPEKMEELEPEAFYSLIKKFDLEEAPGDFIPLASFMAGLITLIVECFLNPEVVKKQLKGTKIAITLKDGTIWSMEGLPSLVSLLYLLKPIMPEDMQKALEEKLKQIGFIPNNLGLSLEGIF